MSSSDARADDSCRFPDLIPVWQNIERHDTTISARLVCTNQGTRKTWWRGSFSLDVYFSADSYLDSADTKVMSRGFYEALAIDESTEPVVLTYSPETSPQGAYLIAVLVPDDIEVQSDVANDVQAIRVP